MHPSDKKIGSLSTLASQNLGLIQGPGPADSLGVYLHIPYCSQLCSYCDFAKTANWDKEVTRSYFQALRLHLKLWLEYLNPNEISTVFLGGGTPGLFTNEWESIFSELSPYLSRCAEITIETNPADISQASLTYWKSVGITRLSIGVQSFDASGLQLLGRDHQAETAQSAIKLALAYFSNVNIDLIYGWPGQDLEIWKRDLSQAVRLRVPHLSLYNLTYEKQTRLGRQERRGLVEPIREDLESEFYFEATRILADKSYQHEEVSNWSLPGFSCRHNWLYWERKPVLAIGAGAHGFLSSKDGFGFAYSYEKNDRKFFRKDPESIDQILLGLASNQQIELDRSLMTVVEEIIVCGLRSCRGVDFGRIRSFLGSKLDDFLWRLKNQPKLPFLLKGDVCLLISQEWFREQYWALQLMNLFEESLKGSDL